MGSRTVGERVGAIARADKETVWLFGYGTYQGERVPDPALGVRMFGMPMDHENPCLLLDSGKLIFGCECWWASEARVKEIIGDRRVVEVDIVAERAAAQETRP